jgi:hypothetical protein
MPSLRSLVPAGPVALPLLAVVSVVLVLRLARPPVIGMTTWFAVMLVGGVSAGLLFTAAPAGVAPAFAPVIAGAAGFLFETRRAVIVSLAASLTAAVGMIARHGDVRYAWVAVLGLAVVVGMTRRDRVRTLVLMREKVEQSDRAIASESRAQVLANGGRPRRRSARSRGGRAVAGDRRPRRGPSSRVRAP